MATDDDELSPFGLVEEMTGRVLPHEQTVHGDIGVTLLPAGEAFRQDLLRRGLTADNSRLGMLDTSASLQACSATKSTPRQEASSNATDVANSDAGEPSTPTSTGNFAGRGGTGISSWITATGQWA